MSWNGATEVAGWRLVTGDDAGSATGQPTVPRGGFETSLPLPGEEPYVTVEALDADGQVLGSTTAAATPSG